MNKILIFPILIMFMFALFGTALPLIDNPASEGDETGEGEQGEWVQSESSAQWAWFNYETGQYYPATGTGMWVGMYFNPSLEENNDKSFQIFNMDEAEWEYYANYAAFEEKYGVGGSGLEGPNDIFDTGAMWFLIGGLLTAGIVAGVAIFGSGLSEWAQYMIFVNGAYGAFWLFLSAGAYDLLIDEGQTLGIFGNLIYISLTLLYIIGIVTETSGGK